MSNNEKLPTRILLVEDDEGYALLLKRLFERNGVNNEIINFADGYQFLEFIGSSESEKSALLVLLDLNLPLLNGFQILRRVRASRSKKALPVIVLSTTVRENDVGMVYELGGNAFLKKPIAFEDFEITVRKLGIDLDTSK